jgi:hypothetical protein
VIRGRGTDDAGTHDHGLCAALQPPTLLLTPGVSLSEFLREVEALQSEQQPGPFHPPYPATRVIAPVCTSIKEMP